MITSKVKQFGRGVISDGADTNAVSAPLQRLTKHAKTLIVFFSRSGHTEQLADLAQRLLDADIFELVVRQPYPANYQQTVSRCVDEQENIGLPELKPARVPDFGQYTTILLGHPIWNMTIANPMQTFLNNFGTRLGNSRIASFSTNAGYGNGDTQQVLHHQLPASSQILTSYTVEDCFAHANEEKFVQWLQKTTGQSKS